MDALVDFFRAYQPITDEDAAVITSFFIERQFKEGAYLFEGKRRCKELFFIVSGTLRIVATNDKGVEITYHFIGKKQFCTILQSFNNDTMTDDGIQACCNTHVLSITKQSLKELYQQLPFLEKVMNQVNQERMLEKIRLKNAYAGKDAVEKYKAFLKEQSEIALDVPQNYIASYLNITPQSLSRIRRNM